MSVIRLNGAAYRRSLPGLSGLLVDAVSGGASVGWPGSLDEATALAWWAALADRVDGGQVVVLVALELERVVGTVQLRLAEPPNGAHRADIAKLLVLRSHRRAGLATALMRAAEETAAGLGRTLLMLDTVTGSPADSLYRKLGWIELGAVPGYALVDGGEPISTTYFYRRLEAVSRRA